MSNEQLPEPEQATMSFEEKTPLATMISGGIFVAVAVYFVLGWFLSTFRIDLSIIQWIGAGLVLLVSIQMGLKPQAKIKINRKTGWIEAEASGMRWSGYANEVKRFIVLERKIEGRNNQIITEYKLHLKLDEKDQFDVMLKNSEVRDAIKWVEDAKKSLPPKGSSEKMLSQ